MISLQGADITLIALYFIIIFSIAIWSKISSKKSNTTEDKEYFLAGRNLSWFVIGASLFASNIGSEHLIGLAGSGAASGVAVAHFEILAAFALLLLGYLFAPYYLKSGVVTMPEFLQKRYCKSARTYLSLVSVLGYVLTKISVTIYAGATVFESIGVPFWSGALIIVIATGAYTIFGGLRAVLYTDMIQMFIMIFGAFLVSYFGLAQLGGIDGLMKSVPTEYFNMWKPSSHPDYPWTGILFGAPILGIWYWCTDQFIVQRVLAARNIKEARRGTLFAALLKQTPLFIFIIPGIICYALAQNGSLILEKPDMALPTLVAAILPTGIKGIVVAGLLAALMSSLSSVFNSCSTLITYDFFKELFPKSSSKKLVIVGQISTTILVLLGMAWIPLMGHITGGLFKYLQSVQAYISPPIAAVFLWGIFFKNINSRGCMLSLWTGFFLGIGRLILEINKGSLSGILYYISDINFLHFAIILFAICSVVLFLGSRLKEEKEKIDPCLILDTHDSNYSVPKLDKALILFVLIFIAITWFIFS